MSTLLVIFFVSLFLPLDIGGFIEMYWALALIVLWIVNIGRNTAIHPPKNLVIIYSVVAFTLILTASVSKSLSSSVFSIVRYLEGFVICMLAARFTDTPECIISTLLWVGRITVLLFLGFLFIPEIAIYIPRYTSVLAVNGHHPIAYLLVILVPLLNSPRQTNRWIHIVDFGLVALGLTASGARGAWLVISVYLFMLLLRERVITRSIALHILFFLITSLLATNLWFSVLPYNHQVTILNKYPLLIPYARDVQKGLRLEYVNQALRSLKDAPLMGLGPGSFHLISRAYQQKPMSFTRYTHSFLFETLAENGSLGSIPIILLFLTVGAILLRILVKEKNKAKTSLSTAALLLLLYSIFEVTFNMLSIWLLFWALCGYLTAQKKFPAAFVYSIPMALSYALLLFLLSFVASVAYAAGSNIDAALTVAPYRKDIALSVINKTPPSRLNVQPYTFWYREDLDIIFALAQKHTEASLSLYREVLRLDPYNTDYLKAYLLRLVELKHYDQMEAMLCDIKKRTSRNTTSFCTYLSSPEFAAYTQSPSSFITPLGHLSGSYGLAKLFYFLGWDIYTEMLDPTGAVLMMEVARDIAPDWGFYHLELASTQLHGAGDDEATKATLLECVRLPAVRPVCTPFQNDLTSLPLPGTHAADIEAIPNISAP